MRQFWFLLTILFVTGCAIKEPKWNYVENVRKYQFVFIAPTSTKNVKSGSMIPVYGFGYVGSSQGQSLDPRQAIANELMKYGFIITDDKDGENTLYVSYGEGGDGYSPEVSIQMTDLANKKLVYSCSASGGYAMSMGTSTDNFKYAISQCLLGLKAYFKE
ncbi:DUF4136 domain-containing protein [Helicobacter pametensis]|uniref:DUF4136 domain-containing protein n=1 Tax=Helicobacter pametensis TaxID=95149 RepID=UPI00048069D0|nr:DUF4136 domain-containing protein [Helicobacter pametensis]